MLIFYLVSRYLDSYGVDSTQYGVAHSDELWQLWNIYFGVYWVNRPEVDLLSYHTVSSFDCRQNIVSVSDAMLEMWINFASFGDPTPPGSGLETAWAPVTPEDHRYLVIGKRDLHISVVTNYSNFSTILKVRFE